VPRNQNHRARYIKNHDTVDVHVLSASRGDGLWVWRANVAGAGYLETIYPFFLNTQLRSNSMILLPHFHRQWLRKRAGIVYQNDGAECKPTMSCLEGLQILWHR